MYPVLLRPLLILLGIGLAILAALAVRRPIARRLGLRQVRRRPTETVLAVIGSVLGTAIIIGALVVGDTLNFSVRQVAYRTLGPVDERIVTADPALGRAVAARLGPLSKDPQVDGVLTARMDRAAAVNRAVSPPRAEPRVLAWQSDFRAAERFGARSGDTGISGPNPAPGHAVVNAPLAASLDVRAGQEVTVYLYGRPTRLRIDRVLPERGLAGTGTGAAQNRNIFLAPGALTAAARAAHAAPRSVTLVSNRGGVEGGDRLTGPVGSAIVAALGPLATRVPLEHPKHDVLVQARQTGDSLGSLFLMIGSFSIIAGALLLVNIFVMLGEERKSQLGMLRAIGMKRSELIGSFTLEGGAYALLSVVPGVAIGVAIGYLVALVAARIFAQWSASGGGLDIVFDVTPVSIVNGAALGLVVALATVLATSVRISRFNVIAAIRDLPAVGARRPRRLLVTVSTAAAVLFAVAAVPAVARSQPEATFLFPSAAAVFATPALARMLPLRIAVSITSAAVLAWSLVAALVRPQVFDTPSMAIYVILGSLTAFSAVVLISVNQSVLLAPVRFLLGRRPSEGGLATRLAVAYPLAKRFRTGATLVMYTLIMLVLVLLTQINGVINAGIDRSVADATAGYSLRLDLNPTPSHGRILGSLREGPLRGSRVVPLVTASGRATDPGHRTTDLLRTAVVGVPPGTVDAMHLSKRLPGLHSDAAVWRAVAADTRYVVLDRYFGQIGGPPGDYYGPGDRLTLIDPATGRQERKIIAGVLASGLAFYPNDGSAAYPVVAADRTVRELYGPGAQVTAALATTPPGVSPDRIGAVLQARYLTSSLVVTPIATDVRRMFAANTAFFRLMQGFLGLGLLVGITGLGIVMVRSVRERRRDIGVLRALGFRAGTIETSFLIESGFVALQGIVLGAGLGVLTTWLMYLKSAQFATLHGGFPIEWIPILVLVAATFVASLVATVGPSKRAAQIRPALAVRVAD